MALPKVTAPTYELELPSSGKKIKYRPFLVKEEKILLIALDSKDEKQITQALIDVLNACVISRVKIEDLPSFDLEYVFLKVRAASVGEEITLNVTCTDDNKTKVAHTININDVQVHKPKGHNSKIMINKTVGVILKYPSLTHFIDVGFLTDKELDGMEIILNSIDQIFDGEDVTEASECTKKELTSFVESLTQNQFKKVSKFFETMPKLKHEFTVTNPNTKKQNKYSLEGLASFFA
tara:strand:+ start:4582 stop:5289 length:708 start_codon:yes stop_codon:yes gene_type:complete